MYIALTAVSLQILDSLQESMPALDINDCINEICPWSGKLVQADSLIKHDGKVVGFCNPGCRDNFEAAIRHLEGTSLPIGRETPDGSNHVSVCKKRLFRSHGNSDFDGIKLKETLIYVGVAHYVTTYRYQ